VPADAQPVATDRVAIPRFADGGYRGKWGGIPRRLAGARLSRLDDFRQGLGAHGFAEGKNVDIEYRWASGDRAKLPALAEELVRMKVDVIATGGGGLPPRAAAAVTDTIPIVASSAATIVESLAGRKAISPAPARRPRSSIRSGWSCCTRRFPMRR
jgi:hypothetical protein